MSPQALPITTSPQAATAHLAQQPTSRKQTKPTNCRNLPSMVLSTNKPIQHHSPPHRCPLPLIFCYPVPAPCPYTHKHTSYTGIVLSYLHVYHLLSPSPPAGTPGLHIRARPPREVGIPPCAAQLLLAADAIVVQLLPPICSPRRNVGVEFGGKRCSGGVVR